MLHTPPLVHRGAPPLVSLLLSALCLCLWPLGAARADFIYPPLRPVPAALVHQLGPLLRGNDLVLIESEADGGLKQITSLTLVAAAPEQTRDVLIHAERYSEFVRNMPRSTVKHNPDGTFDHHYVVAYSIVTSDGANRYQLLPKTAGEEDEPAPVRFFDITGTSHMRWEFHRPASGGGTIVAVTGYSDLRHSGGIYRALLQHAQTLEHGMALVVQTTLMLAMKARAEQQPGTFPPFVAPPAGARAATYQPLLDRGVVALLRNQDGRLADFSLIERSSAAPERVLQVASQVAEWARFVPTISKSVPQAQPSIIDLEQNLPLVSFRTLFQVHPGPTAVDLFGMNGDLRGARMRFDARPALSSSPDAAQKGRTQVVLRGQVHYDHGSMVLRQLYKLEPLFEYGINLGLGLTLLRGVRQQAERP